MQQSFEFVGNHPFLFTALFVIIVLMLMNESRRRLLGFREVTPAEAVRLINQEDALMLDVREDKEYRAGHVINAINIPLGVLEGRLHELDKDKPVVVYCQTGQRAARAASILQRQGFAKVYKMNGGMTAWTGASMPVAR